MVADLRPGVRPNVRTSQWIAGIAGSGVGLLAGAVLANAAAVIASVTVLGPAVGASAVVAGACLYTYRKYYPSVLRKAEDEMRRALGAVSAALQSEAVFGVIPGSGRLTRGTGASGDVTATIGGSV